MKHPKVMVVRVQQQQGTVDCGLLAIAYAVSLASGKDPAKNQQSTHESIFDRLQQEQKYRWFSY